MDKYFSVKKAALYADRSESTIRRWCSRRGLPYYNIGRSVLIKSSDLDEWLEKYRRVDRLAQKVLKNALTNALPLAIEEEKGGKSELAKKKPTCFNYGFGHVRLRTYRSGRSCWTIDYRDENGKRIQQALPHAQSREEAVFTLQKKVAEVFDRKHGIERKRKKIGFSDFAKICLEDYMMTARRNFQSDVYRLHKLCSYFKVTDLRSITPLTVERFRKSKLREGRTKSTCNRYLALMKRMFNVAIEEGCVEENPVQKVKLYSEKDTLKERILTEEEEERKFHEACADYLKPIIAVALNTGVRKGEILNLK